MIGWAIAMYFLVGFIIDIFLVHNRVMCTYNDEIALALVFLFWIVLLPCLVLYIIWCAILKILEVFEK